MAEKKETREKLKPIADRIFKSNKDLGKVYLCSNGQGYTDEKSAKKYAKQFTDDSVYIFENPFLKEQEDVDANREELLNLYEELSGKPAPYNIKNDTLIAKVEELKKELTPKNE